MPNIEELREDLKALRMQYGTNQSTIEGAGLLNEICDVYLAAIEDAQRYKKDENGLLPCFKCGEPKIEELREEIQFALSMSPHPAQEHEKRIALAAIEDAQRYKKDENGNWRFLTAQRYWTDVAYGDIPAAVRAVLEVTGGGE